MPHTTTRTIRLNQPLTAYEVTGRGKNKTTHEISLNEALNDIKQLITLVHDHIQSRLTLTRAYQDKALLNDYSSWAKEIDAQYDRNTTTQIVQSAIRAGITINNNELPCEILTKSRVSWLILGHYASKLKAWGGDPHHLPSAGWDVNLGYTNSQMTIITQHGKTVKLHLKAWNREIILAFRKPSCSLRKAEKLGLPIINMDPATRRLTFSCPVQSKTSLPAISHDYVIGVDRGIAKYFTLAVIDTRTGEPVFITDSTGVLEEAHLKLTRQDGQVIGLHRALDRAIERRDHSQVHVLRVELDRARKARSRLKLQLARDSAKFIIGVSRLYGNAVVCFEDLSWSGNWGSREPYGLLLHETEWQAEKDGLLCYTVPAAYSSQSCSSCQAGSFEPVDHSFIGRVFHCAGCGFFEDRDVNASVNVATRGVDRAVKSARTRDRSKDCETPRRMGRRFMRCHARVVPGVVGLITGTAGGGLSGRSVPSGRGLVGPVADPGSGWLVGYGVVVIRLRV